MPKMTGGIKTGRFYVRLPKETIAEIDGYIKESGMYQACFLSYALVVGARAGERQRALAERRQLRAESPGLEEGLLKTKPDHYSDTVPYARVVEQQRRVKRVLEQIAPEQKQALELSYYEGLSQSQIASRLGASHDTVKTRMTLGLEHFKALLLEDGVLPT